MTSDVHKHLGIGHPCFTQYLYIPPLLLPEIRHFNLLLSVNISKTAGTVLIGAAPKNKFQSQSSLSQDFQMGPNESISYRTLTVLQPNISKQRNLTNFSSSDHLNYFWNAHSKQKVQTETFSSAVFNIHCFQKLLQMQSHRSVQANAP